ncbi:MAG: hypothetical protein JWQ67_522 [Marmoricola sp.]|jgi:uncharacterized protein YcnI|nr:hypothetical protein [Marmoricola sp.]MCW2826906.1 hypothetical protein [Marmoricola sp.]
MFQSTPTSSTSPFRVLVRIGTGLGAGLAATIALPGVAAAHVTVQPDAAEAGSFSVVAFRVPSERDDAHTTRLRVVLPDDHPIGSVQTTPVPGWSVATSTRTLATPITLFGEKLSKVVSQVTWTATNRGLAPGQFQDFSLSLGQLPESGEMVFRAVQTYSNGEQVNWNEVSADRSVEPEHPAPTLRITPAAAAQGTTANGPSTDASTTGGTGASPATTAAAGTNSNGSDTALPLALSGAALLVSLLAALLSWRRGRSDRPSGVSAKQTPENSRA